MSRKQVEVDAIWRELGTWGKFQIFQVAVVSYNIIPAAFTILTAVFTGYIPEHSCQELNVNNSQASDGITYEYGQCKIKTFKKVDNISELMQTDTCTNGYVYSVPTYTTYTAEWDLVCSRSNLPPLAQSLVLAGQGVGAMFLSHVADRFGRKTVQVLSSIGLLLSACVLAVSPNIIMLLVMRLVAGTFQQGVICTDAPMRLELYPREQRALMGAVGGIGWAIGVMLLALFGYMFQDINWRYLQLALAAWSLISLAEWWIVEESVRWLLVNDKVKETKEILKKAAKWNGVEYNRVDKVLTEVLNESSTQPSANDLQANHIACLDDVTISTVGNQQAKNNTFTQKSTTCENIAKAYRKESSLDDKVVRYSIIDIMKDSKLRVNTLILWFAWFTVASTYYGLTLVSTHLSGDRFVNFFLSGLFEIPAAFLLWYFCDRIGRKKSIVLFYGVTAFSLIIATALLTNLGHVYAVSITATGLALIGKMMIAGAFSLMFLYTPEIYPTNYRNRGLGIASSLSRIGAVLAPFASNLALIALWIPAAIFGGMCLLVMILSLKLPESKHFELPQYLQEIEKWSEQEGKTTLDAESEKETKIQTKM